MPSKIPPRVREQAAIYCSARASYWAASGSPYFAFDYFSSRATNLATQAFMVREAQTGESYPLLWGEAHALLMTGWEP